MWLLGKNKTIPLWFENCNKNIDIFPIVSRFCDRGFAVGVAVVNKLRAPVIAVTWVPVPLFHNSRPSRLVRFYSYMYFQWYSFTTQCQIWRQKWNWVVKLYFYEYLRQSRYFTSMRCTATLYNNFSLLLIYPSPLKVSHTWPDPYYSSCPNRPTLCSIPL